MIRVKAVHEDSNIYIEQGSNRIVLECEDCDDIIEGIKICSNSNPFVNITYEILEVNELEEDITKDE